MQGPAMVPAGGWNLRPIRGGFPAVFRLSSGRGGTPRVDTRDGPCTRPSRPRPQPGQAMLCSVDAAGVAAVYSAAALVAFSAVPFQ